MIRCCTMHHPSGLCYLGPKLSGLARMAAEQDAEYPITRDSINGMFALALHSILHIPTAEATQHPVPVLPLDPLDY
jgi:hypothetical protein